ncbi:pseudouridine synthase [Teredinibacter franksiae]|uniref:pseudouridine synthase n=1 Tax=Teredinibacter franksiae TaxID=2761453 RepID=UPI001627ECD9|nr:pseudouridine synthase [Teredinibacter franksiae]
MPEIVLLNKPFNYLSQFTDKEDRKTLADVFSKQMLANDFYPAGRLDFDSEGLLLLVNSGELQHRISNPELKMLKTYWVQVEGTPDTKAILALQRGVELKDGKTKPARAQLIAEPSLWPRNPPVRKREKTPTQWLELTINEGKNRQVRRMTAAVGHPTLRLVRVAIGPWSIGKLNPGEYTLETVNLPAKKQQKSVKQGSNKRLGQKSIK